MNSSTESTQGVQAAEPEKLKPQVSLLSLLLLIAACGVWVAYWKATRDIANIEAPLQGLRLIARELVIEDPNQIAAVKRFPGTYGQKVMDIYIPELAGKDFVLRLAMDDIPISKNFQADKFEALKESVLKPGKHEVEIRYDKDAQQAVLTILVDGEVAIEEKRAKDWVNSGGHSSSSSVESSSKSFENDEIIQLLHLRFMLEGKTKGTFSTPKTPGPGISVWIEAVEDSVSAEQRRGD